MANTTIDSSLKAYLDLEKLTPQNFRSWLSRLRLILRKTRKSYVLVKPLPQEPPYTSIEDHKDWSKHKNDSIEVSNLMLDTMEPFLREDMELLSYTAYEMAEELKWIYRRDNHPEYLKNLQLLENTKMQEGQDVSTHVERIRTILEEFDKLYRPYPKELAIDVILKSLTPKFDAFKKRLGIKVYSISQLHTMLQIFDKNLSTEAFTCDMCGYFGHGREDCHINYFLTKKCSSGIKLLDRTIHSSIFT